MPNFKYFVYIFWKSQQPSNLLYEKLVNKTFPDVRERLAFAVTTTTTWFPPFGRFHCLSHQQQVVAEVEASNPCCAASTFKGFGIRGLAIMAGGRTPPDR